MPELSVNSPLGPVTLVEADGAIIELNWRQARRLYRCRWYQDQILLARPQKPSD